MSIFTLLSSLFVFSGSKPISSRMRFCRLVYFCSICFICVAVLCQTPLVTTAHTPHSTKSTTTAALATVSGEAAVVNHSPIIEGRVEGSIRQLLPEPLSIAANAVVSSKISVAGSPNVKLMQGANFNGIVAGTGKTEPAGYEITLQPNSTVKQIFTRVDSQALDPIKEPTTSNGSLSISVSSSDEKIDFSLVKDLSLLSGSLAVPAGSYGTFSLASSSSFILGQPNSTTVYHFEQLLLSTSSKITLAGPVVINLLKPLVVPSGAIVGSESSPVWLQLNSISSVTVDKSTVFALINAPKALVTIGTDSKLKGHVSCDRLVVKGLIQTLSADSQPPVLTLSSPDNLAVVSSPELSVRGTASDDSFLSVKVNNSSAQLDGNIFTATVKLSPGLNTLTITATDIFGKSSTISRQVKLESEENKPPVVAAGVDKFTLFSNNSVNLAASVKDDGLPSNSLSISWSKLTGPGTVTFSSATSASTRASFSLPGVYLLRFSASDGKLSATDDVKVTVAAAELVPTLDCVEQHGEVLVAYFGYINPNPFDITVPIGGIGLESSIFNEFSPAPLDRGQPTTFNPTGPQGEKVVFKVVFAPSASISWKLGTRTVTASSASRRCGEADNQPPVVNAGQDQTLVLPATVLLNPTVTDDGKPSGTISLTWTKQSGPGNVSFTEVGSQTRATFSQPGVYVLKLTASDSVLSSSDSLSVTLNQRPLIPILSYPYGFSVEQLSLSKGEKLLLIKNQSGQDDLTYVINQSGQQTTVNLSNGNTAYIYLNLTSGQVVITETNNQDWRCTITVVQ